jgi:hypothetical protein
MGRCFLSLVQCNNLFLCEYKQRLGINPGRAKYFSSPKRPDRVGTHPALYSIGTEVVVGWRLGREVDNSPATSAEIKNDWSYTAITPTPMPSRHRQGQLCFIPTCLHQSLHIRVQSAIAF